MNMLDYKPNRNFFLYDLKDIIKIDNGYKLQSPYDKNETDETTKINQSVESWIANRYKKCCDICIYHKNYNRTGTCDIRDKLENNSSHLKIYYSHWNNICNAYTPVYSLTIIRSEEEMIQFIEKTENFFDCPEDYESFYGFERKWDEDGTGEILETTRKYYDAGGKFSKIPNRYPCVIYFAKADQDNYCYDMEKLHWIYIGDMEYINDKERT